ncbi:MAG: YlbF family regulator [Atopostipes sp.]|nr:YlbF family regulator [Atopostipes sp.]
MVNIHDTANQLEQDLRETSQYNELKEAHKNVLADEEAAEILNEFQSLQQKLQKKQQAGEEITEEEAQEAQVLPIKMQSNELTKELMEKEQGLNTLLTEVNGIIMKPVQEIYEQ